MNLRFLAPAAAALALAACSDDGPTFVEVEPQAYVRWVNAMPGSPALVGRFTDRVENQRTWDQVAFRGHTGYYIAVNAGSRQLTLFRSSANIDTAQMMVLQAPLELRERTYYTIVSTGRVAVNMGQAGNTAALTVFEDTLPDPTSIAANQIRVRAYNLVEGSGQVSVAINDTTAAAGQRPVVATLANVPFGQRSAYVTVPALSASDTTSAYRFRATTAAGTALVTATPDLPGLPAIAGSTVRPPVAPVAGVRQGRSFLSLFLFGPAPTGTPTTGGALLVPDVNPPAP